MAKLGELYPLIPRKFTNRLRIENFDNLLE